MFCGPYGGDYALDIDSNQENTPARLYLDYTGYGSGYQYAPDNDSPISIEIYFGPVLNSRGGDPACYYQRIDVYVDYFVAGSGTHREDLIGYVWLQHLDNWQYENETVTSFAQRDNPSGDGTIYYWNGLIVGDIYDGSGACSDGSHVHLEWYSRHAWGAPFEWHGAGPDYYYYGHVHYQNDEGGNYQKDSAGSGNTVGFIGGGTTSAAMWDNPNYGDH